MNDLVDYRKESIVKQIDSFLQSKEFANLSTKELEYISKSLLIDKLKDELKLEIKKSKINIESLKNQWLSLFSSSFTKKTYSQGIDIFFQWLKKRDSLKNIINLKAIDYDDYISYLKRQKLTDNTIQLRIASVSSFITYLQRIDVLDKNYFKGCKSRPKRQIEIKTYNDIPDDEAIKVIEKELWKEYRVKSGSGYKGKKESARIGLAVITIIKSHGLRIRALKNLEIDSKGFYKSISKGGFIHGRFDAEIIKTLHALQFKDKTPFKNFETETIQLWFRRFCLRLIQKGKLKTVYSLHDLRHYAAIKHWEKYQNIYKLKNFLGHKSIATSQVYLASLNVEVDL